MGALSESRSGSATAESDSMPAEDGREKTAGGDLDRANPYRSVFLARLAHELRTPLTSILGFSEILLGQEDLTEAQRNFCERIQSSAHQLRHGLNQLSALSRLEAGRSEIRAEEFSLHDLLPQACGTFARKSQKQKSEVSWAAAPDLPMIVSDRGLLRQVIESFLDFMISRSSEGGAVNAIAERTARGFLIKFEGDGDPLTDPDSVGVLDITDQRSTTSVDLGLAIARHHIDLLGGTLNIENREPKGVKVTLEFPAAISV